LFGTRISRKKFPDVPAEPEKPKLGGFRVVGVFVPLSEHPEQKPCRVSALADDAPSARNATRAATKTPAVLSFMFGYLSPQKSPLLSGTFCA
jgi:hypothetical protein